MVKINYDKWEPTKSQILWAQELVNKMNENGIWQSPTQGASYKFVKSKRELHFLKGDENHTWHKKNVILFSRIGFKVIDKRGINGETIEAVSKNLKIGQHRKGPK